MTDQLDDIAKAISEYTKSAAEWRDMTNLIAHLEREDRYDFAPIDLVYADSYRKHALPRLASIARAKRTTLVKLLNPSAVPE